MKPLLLLALGLTFTLFLTLIAQGATTSGEVLTCRDGDTCKVAMYGGIYAVRLKHIDAPELKQPFGIEARNHLNELIAGRTVNLNCGKYSTFFRRYNCSITTDKLNVAEAMVAAGYAWDYTQFSRGKYKPQEQQARAHKRGLWQQENPITPYCFRHKNKPVCLAQGKPQ